MTTEKVNPFDCAETSRHMYRRLQHETREAGSRNPSPKYRVFESIKHNAAQANHATCPFDTCLEPRPRALRVDCGGRLADGLGGGGQGGADLGGGDFQRVRRRLGHLAKELSLRLFN